MCKLSGSFFLTFQIARGRQPQTRFKYFCQELISHRNLQYGRDMEGTARKKYEEVTGARVHEAGLIICEEQPWLACSTDGIIVGPSGELMVLEIKCPIKCREDRISVEYVRNGELKKTDQYYFQVQMQMYLCKAKKCHFFVFSTADYLLLEIDLDEAFL